MPRLKFQIQLDGVIRDADRVKGLSGLLTLAHRAGRLRFQHDRPGQGRSLYKEIVPTIATHDRSKQDDQVLAWHRSNV